MADETQGAGGKGWSDADAAEIVLGTATAEERRAALARVHADPAFAAAIARWEARFGPLAEGLAEIGDEEPPEAVWEGIERAIEGGEGQAAIIPLPSRGREEMDRKLRFWKSLASISVAACLALVVALGLIIAEEDVQDAQFVAVFNATDQLPDVVVSFDLETRMATVRRIGAEPVPSGQTYQLWIQSEPGTRPVSVGLVSDGTEIEVEQLSDPEAIYQFGLSVEPEGGSEQPSEGALHSPLIPTE